MPGEISIVLNERICLHVSLDGGDGVGAVCVGDLICIFLSVYICSVSAHVCSVASQHNHAEVRVRPAMTMSWCDREVEKFQLQLILI